MRSVEELFMAGGHWVGTFSKKPKICINDCFDMWTCDVLGVSDIFQEITTPHDTINLGIFSFTETYLNKQL